MKTYTKDTTFDPIYKQASKSFYFKSRVLPISLSVLGIVVVITNIIIPLFFFTTQDTTPELVSSTILGTATGFSEFEFKELDYEYTPTKNEQQTNNGNVPDFFYITIPKLRIKDAKVETNASHLKPDNALGHYPGSALPDKPGNSFIFGHSVLPVFYNPKNYKTIFSTLSTLQKGDRFSVKYNNKVYEYEVESKVELKPELVDPLAEIKPKYLNESTMILMTCSPAGTKLRRLLVNAVQISQDP